MADISIKITQPSLQVGIKKKEASVKISGKVIESLDTTRFKFFQIPTPIPDGATTIFTTPDAYVASSLTVYRDKLALQGNGIDFTETDPDTGAFQVTEAPDSDEVLWCNYIKQ